MKRMKKMMMNTMRTGSILGICPGTRFVGIAIIRDKELVQYHVKAFFGVWSHQKLRTIVSMVVTAIEQHHVTAVAVKIPDRLPGSPGYTQLLGVLNVACERKGIRPRYYAFSDIKARHCAGEHTSAELMKSIAQNYPELLPEYQKERKKHKYKDAYYHKLFEAVAAANMLSAP
jgi:Holliday junction resolvasome RuvABC endonuclease subunit